MAKHSITIIGLEDEEEVSFFKDACENNLSDSLASCLIRILKGKKYKVLLDIDVPVIVHNQGKLRKDGGTLLFEVLNSKDVGFDYITYDGRRDKPTSGLWLSQDKEIASERIQKIDKYKYRQNLKLAR